MYMQLHVHVCSSLNHHTVDFGFHRRQFTNCICHTHVRVLRIFQFILHPSGTYKHLRTTFHILSIAYGDSLVSSITLRLKQIIIQVEGHRPGRPLAALWLYREHQSDQLASRLEPLTPDLSPSPPHCRVQCTEEPTMASRFKQT